MSFRRSLLPWLSLLTLLWALQLEAGPKKPEYVRTRDRGVCGIVLSRAGENGKVDDTNGVKVAPLDVKAFKRFLDREPELEGAVVVTGLPVFGPRAEQFAGQVKAMLAEYGFPDVPVKIIREPQGTGLHRALEEARYLLPMSSDYQTPVLAETMNGLAMAAAGNVSLAIFAFKNYPERIAIPMVVTNMGVDLVLSVYRRTISNWINRSSGNPLAFGEKLVKECILGTTATLGIYASSRWEEVAKVFRESGLMELLCQTPAAAGTFAGSQWATIAANGLLFTTLFNGIYSWDQMRSVTPDGNERVRRTSPVLMTAIFAAATPAMAMAASSTQYLPIPGLTWLNPGHLILFGFAGVGSMVWSNPLILDYTVPVVDKVVYAPIRLVKRMLGLPVKSPSRSQGRKTISPAKGDKP